MITVLKTNSNHTIVVFNFLKINFTLLKLSQPKYRIFLKTNNCAVFLN